MRDIFMAKKTARLAIGVRAKLIEAGCYHNFKNGSKLPVPTDKTCYDSTSGLIWTEMNISRLPRGYTVETLRKHGLEKMIEEYVKQPVVIDQVDDRFVVMSMVEPMPRTSSTRQRARDLTLANT